jgi:hypothetical protein|tara:strand:+ start:286 stop:462 length:177 start_codon:yes stop_codon:yes gene_type:complete
MKILGMGSQVKVSGSDAIVTGLNSSGITATQNDGSVITMSLKDAEKSISEKSLEIIKV